MNESADRAESRSPMLRLAGVTRRFGDFVAVDDISLAIEQGEFLTLLGPSGSGKSTTLYMIAGFDQPSHGDIYIGDRSVAGLSPNRRNVGMVFQRYSLFPHMTVRANVGFPLSVRKWSRKRIDQRVDETLRLVQLSDFAHRKPAALSGGQQQRVALARALVYEPRILLMDEPLSALDRKLREDLQQEIRALHARLGTTIVYVTHDQEEALRMSDRIAVFNEGRIVQQGTGEDLYHRPANSFVASFIGGSTFVTGRVARLADARVAVTVADEHTQLYAPAVEGLRQDAPVLLMVRPESICVQRSEPVQDADRNGLEATIREAVFLGDNVTYIATTGGGRDIQVKQALRGSDGESVRAGERCHLSWRVADTHAFSDWNEDDIQRQLE